MYFHEEKRIRLPRELIDYSEGVSMSLPAGNWAVDDLRIARSLRRTFFRRLQRNRPGLQYQWDDYQILMHEEIIKYVKRSITKNILAEWDQIRQRIPRLYSVYDSLLKQRFNLPKCLLVENTLPTAALSRIKKDAILQAARDPRTLGEMEDFVHGNVFYGIPVGCS
jgi:hypothetical protein